LIADYTKKVLKGSLIFKKLEFTCRYLVLHVNSLTKSVALVFENNMDFVHII